MPKAVDVSRSTDHGLKLLTRLFKALADENRLRILSLLARHKELHVAVISQQVGQAQPAVSHHLNQLRTAGLIESRRDGRFNFYFLSVDGLRGVIGAAFGNDAPVKITVGGIEVTVKRK